MRVPVFTFPKYTLLTLLAAALILSLATVLFMQQKTFGKHPAAGWKELCVLLITKTALFRMCIPLRLP